MLKRRIIPVILYRGSQVVKGRQFDSWRSVGHVRQSVRIYQAREVDELVILDIGATPDGREPDFDLISDLTEQCFMPITIGGGIRTLEHFRLALRHGADKVAIGSAALECPELIRDASTKFGSNAVVVSIDVKDGRVIGECGKGKPGPNPMLWARKVESYGAGEIILNDINRDGMMDGYNLDLIEQISNAVRIPVVACGGAGSYNDFAAAFKHGAHAVAASAMFCFSDQTPAEAAEYLSRKGVPVRRRFAA